LRRWIAARHDRHDSRRGLGGPTGGGAARPVPAATAPEQQFLLRLLVGELRQGALAAVMVEAIAAAAELPVAQVRRAAMYSKSLGAVARAALLEGADALGRFQLELFSPVAPMLAQTAADVPRRLESLRRGGVRVKMDGARIQYTKGALTCASIRAR